MLASFKARCIFDTLRKVKQMIMKEFRELRIEMALDDWWDKWGTALNWHFRICDVLQSRNADIPIEWGFQVGLGLLDNEDIFSDILNKFDNATLIRMGNVLSRYVRLCDRAGLSY